jgi:hypothetical protein
MKSDVMFDKSNAGTTCKKVWNLVRADCDLSSHRVMRIGTTLRSATYPHDWQVFPASIECDLEHHLWCPSGKREKS